MLSAVGNRAECAMAKACLTARATAQAGTKVGHSDPVGLHGRPIAQRIKGTPVDNRLIPPKSPYRRRGLAPRCRLITSWGCSRSQGYGCSPFKVVRELGLERRETVRSLSAAGVGSLRGAAPSTRGPEWTNLWCSGCRASGIAG